MFASVIFVFEHFEGKGLTQVGLAVLAHLEVHLGKGTKAAHPGYGYLEASLYGSLHLPCHRDIGMKGVPYLCPVDGRKAPETGSQPFGAVLNR